MYKRQTQHQAREKQRAEIDAVAKAFRQQQIAQVEARRAAMTVPEREAFDQAFLRANALWAKSYQQSGFSSPMVRAAFQQFAVERLLTAEQKDLVAFARAQGLSPEAINLLHLTG